MVLSEQETGVTNVNECLLSHIILVDIWLTGTQRGKISDLWRKYELRTYLAGNEKPNYRITRNCRYQQKKIHIIEPQEFSDNFLHSLLQQQLAAPPPVQGEVFVPTVTLTHKNTHELQKLLLANEPAVTHPHVLCRVPRVSLQIEREIQSCEVLVW